MAERMTSREREILKRVTQAFPAGLVAATVVENRWLVGRKPVLRMSLDHECNVDIERRRIEWPAESLELLSEAAVKALELQTAKRTLIRAA